MHIALKQIGFTQQFKVINQNGDVLNNTDGMTDEQIAILKEDSKTKHLLEFDFGDKPKKPGRPKKTNDN